jgi:hypothetical protein
VTTPQPSLQATARDPERGPHAREDDPPLMPPLALQRGTCVDEAGVNRAMTRRVGRAPRGAQGLGAVPPESGATRTMRAALGRHGRDAGRTIEGATAAAVSHADAAQVRGPTRRPGARVVLEPSRTPGRSSSPSGVPPRPAPAQRWSGRANMPGRP